MNRRAFLASLTAAFALDPERALWTPGKKIISIPRPRVATGNVLILPPEYYVSVRRLMERNRDFLRRVNQEYDREFTR